jgi:high affinity Mn2+ porin
MNHAARPPRRNKLHLRTLTALRRPVIACLTLIVVAPAGLAATSPPTPELSPEAPPQSATSTAPNEPAAPEDWAVHGQSTFVDQYHPGFSSAYRGPNSLDPGSRGDETWDVTLYGGVRPWRGAEIWINPEVDQGFGLSNTLGLAGFSSAEAYKIGQANPYVRLQRLFFRQTIDLGGEVQGIDPDLNQLGGSQTANRLVITAGKFSVVDVFDTNKYAHDPRNDFMNWSVVDAGAFDYAADAWGYSYGTSLEWYQDWWTLRAGYFQGSVTPNSKFIDTAVGHQFQTVVEAEGRYTIFDQPGKLKLLGFDTHARLGRFSALEAFFAANPGASNTDAQAVRGLHNKLGASINGEQQLTGELGAFMRASLDDGRTETYDFTDIDRSLSFGLSLAGKKWQRPDDTLGAAFVVNTISKARKDYLEQGGLGILVGDGKLTNAGPEQIFETTYNAAVVKGVNLSVDYQLVNHPAYNVDRGPVHIIGARLHAQF